MVSDLEFGVPGFGFRVSGLGFQVKNLAVGFMVGGLGFRVEVEVGLSLVKTVSSPRTNVTLNKTSQCVR